MEIPLLARTALAITLLVLWNLRRVNIGELGNKELLI